MTGLDDLAIDSNMAVFNEALKHCAGKVWFAVGEKMIKPLWSFASGNDELRPRSNMRHVKSRKAGGQGL